MKSDLNFCISIIKEVERHPCLYDHNHEDYNNKLVTELAWKEIGEKFAELGSDCKSKWRCIRSSYIRWRKLKNTKSSSKEYYLGPYLRFLIPFTKSRSQDISSPDDDIAEESIEFAEVTNEDGEFINELLDDEINDVRRQWEKEQRSGNEENEDEDDRKAKKRMLTADKYESDEEYIPVARKKMELEAAGSSRNKDPCELYLLSLVPLVKSMTERQLLAFHKGVADLIENIKYPEKASQITSQTP